MTSSSSSKTSSICDFFRDRCVLITGATGFVGKVLVEKLLRCCPSVRCVYVLMRPKKGQDVHSRLSEMLDTKLFENLRHQQPDSINKLIPIQGDITQPALGISVSDTKILVDRVSVVFHSAATVKFDEALNLSVQMNVLGTRRMIELCHKMNNLVCLVHVSTAYCNCDRTDIEEIVYRPDTPPQKLIDALEWMDENQVKSVTPGILKERPNTYTYTKAMAEYVLAEEGANLPIAIVRPSIVVASWKEPFSGWVDNFNGPTGLLMAVGKGAISTIFCQEKFTADFIPVDFTVNLLLSVAWYTAVHRPKQMQVYNCTTGSQNKVTWSDLQVYCFPAFLKYALNDPIWYPFVRYRSNRMLYRMDIVWEHLVPAYWMDMIARLIGRKPQMVKLQEKVSATLKRFEYFTNNQWNFANYNVRNLWDQLDDEDKKVFVFDVRQIIWKEYLENYCQGIKLFLLKEDMSTLPKAKRQLNKMLWVSRLYTLVKVLVTWRLLMRWSRLSRRLWWLIISFAFRLFQSISYLKSSFSS